MEHMTVNTPVDIQMRKFDKNTVAKTFAFHAIANAEALNLCQSMSETQTYEAVVKAALFDNPACGLVPANFLKALHNAFNDFMCVDAVTEVCARLTSEEGVIKFN